MATLWLPTYLGGGGGGGGVEWRHPRRDSHTANFLGAVPEYLLNFWGGAEWTPRDPA